MNDTANNDGIPAEVAKWLKAIVGEYKLAGNYRKHSERTGVWRIQTAGGMRFLKIHKEQRKWHPEVYAYQNWASAYEPYVPRLIAVYESPEAQGVLLSEVEGQPLRQANLPEEQVLRAYETAGRLARQVHSLETGPFFGLPDSKGRPQGEKITDPVQYMTRDLQRWADLDKAEELKCLISEEFKLALWAHDNVEVFSGEPALAINNDYTPGNWLVNARGEFAGVIDLECMQWGLQVDSFAMLWHKYFPKWPEAEQVFFAGYGTDPTQNKPVQSRIIQIKMGVANIIWGVEHDEPNHVILGRENLRKLADSGEAR